MVRAVCVAAIAALLAACVWPSQLAAAEQPKVKQIDIEQFDAMRHAKNTIVLDVRTQQEFDQGHVPGATHIDISSPQFRKRIGELDKSKIYLVHCASGVRSARATRLMARMGFDKLFDFHGGFRAWKAAHKPIEKGNQNNSRVG